MCWVSVKHFVFNSCMILKEYTNIEDYSKHESTLAMKYSQNAWKSVQYFNQSKLET